MRHLLFVLVRLYRMTLSFWVGGQCRFYPSCSQYAEQAVQAHGALRGSYLTLARVLRCHPWHPGGVDLVPQPRATGRQEQALPRAPRRR